MQPLRRQTSLRTIDFRRGKARYQPEERLAVGGMAEVWRGCATFQDGQVVPVAIKRIRPELAMQGQYLQMFRDEARIGMLLRHDHIVRVYDAREVRGTYILIMELVRGFALRDVMQKCFETGTALPLNASLRIGIGVAEALRFAHGAIDDLGRDLQLVHRDISPHNVLLGDDGAVKLMDFGLACASANEVIPDPDEVGGKLQYMAPEILRRRPSSPAVDIFALGVTLWQALAGRKLFHGRDERDTLRRVLACKVPVLQRVNPRVPSLLSDIVGAALSPEPADRPTADQFADGMQKVGAAHLRPSDRDPVAHLVQLHRKLTGQRLTSEAAVEDVGIEP